MSPQLDKHDCIGLTEVSSQNLTSFKQTELRLGLPGSEYPDRVNGSHLSLGFSPKRGSGSKRGFTDDAEGPNNWVFNGSDKNSGNRDNDAEKKVSASKAQVVGWPPIRNSHKNIMTANDNNQRKNNEHGDLKLGSSCLYVKVSLDGAPYLRKVDLKTYPNYKELSLSLEKMFTCTITGQFGSTDFVDGSKNVLTYEDKDGDWMLVGDVPWNMFTETCRRLRIMKGSDAIGLAPRAV